MLGFCVSTRSFVQRAMTQNGGSGRRFLGESAERDRPEPIEEHGPETDEARQRAAVSHLDGRLQNRSLPDVGSLQHIALGIDDSRHPGRACHQEPAIVLDGS